MARNKSYPKDSLGMWNIRTLAFLIGILFLVTQLAFLAINIFLYIEDPQAPVATFLDWFIDHGVKVPFCDENILLNPVVKPPSANQDPSASSSLEAENSNPINPLPTSPISSNSNNHRECIIRKSGDYLAIPVTINLVLILADILLIWATSARIKLWLWPWMILHSLEFLFFVALLVLLMVLIEEWWIKAVIFLIGCPVIILLGFFLFVINCFYGYIKELTLKEAVATVYVKSNNGNPSSFNGRVDPSQPSTMYATEPHTWDQRPIWAINPPQTIWDPEYLQKLDPRYNTGQFGRASAKPSARSAPTYRKMQSRQDKLRAVETILPDGTIVVPLADDGNYIDGYADEFDNDSTFCEQNVDDFGDTRIRYPKASSSNNNKRHYLPNYTQNNGYQKSFSTKALTKSSITASEQDIWNDDNYMGTTENQEFDQDIHNPPTSYKRRDEHNRYNRYPSTIAHNVDIGSLPRNIPENELEEDMSYYRRNWGSGSVPGSLSDKYRATEQYNKEIENNDQIVQMHMNGQGIKMKSGAAVGDDGIITTISENVDAMHEDRCSSIISLSDKYRNQEEIEIFQENFHYKPPPEPIRPKKAQPQTAFSQDPSTSPSNSSNTQSTDLSKTAQRPSEEKENDKESKIQTKHEDTNIEDKETN